MTELSALPVLVVQHEDDCPPALLGGWLTDAGVTLDVRRPYAGEALPADLTGHGGLVVLGGPMGADDDATHPWLTPTKALLREGARGGAPTLGICLGHQLLASALGGSVVVNPGGRQLGLLPVLWDDAAVDDPLVGRLAAAASARCLHWNNDIVAELPPGATALAVAATGELQAVSFTPTAWGIQPHPEVDEHVVGAWASSDDESLAPGEEESGLVSDLVAELTASRAELEAAWRPLAEAFAALVLGARR